MTTHIQSGIYPKGKFTLEDLVNVVKSDPACRDCGAIVTFTGLVRVSSGDPEETKNVVGMQVESNSTLANQSIQQICKTLESRDPDIKRVIICHFEGEFTLFEDLIYVIITSGHREAAFRALSDAVEMYKHEAAIWKKEIFSDGSDQWIP